MQITNQRDYLAEVSDQINELIIGNEENNNKFCEHIGNVIKEAEKYGQYLRAEWQKAKKAGLMYYDENKDEGKWSWWTAYSNDAVGPGGCVYFAEDECLNVQFYIEGKPKIDPLAYLDSMIIGSVGQVYKGIELLDYQFVLLAIIHDAQNWLAGRERIYFNPLEKETLPDRFSHAVWSILEEKFRRTRFYFQDVQKTIETALLAVKADLASKQQREQKPTKASSGDNPAETEQKATPSTINIQKFTGILGGVHQTGNLQVGDHTQIQEITGTEEKNKGILKKSLKIGGAIIVSIIAAVVTDILGEFGLIEGIKAFVYRIIGK